MAVKSKQMDSIKLSSIQWEKYDVLSQIFRYPDPTFKEDVETIQAYFSNYDNAVGEVLKPFSEFVSKTKLSDLEELFTRTFEVQAVTTLDVGYILFGDEYKRAEIMVNFNREHVAAKVDCGDELPDHLVNVLKLLPRLTDKSIAPDIASKILLPALQKMLGEFDPTHLKSKNKVYKKHHKTIIEQSEAYGLIYQFPLRVLNTLLEQDFGVLKKEEKFIKSDFLSSINTEMTIED